MPVFDNEYLGYISTKIVGSVGVGKVSLLFVYLTITNSWINTPHIEWLIANFVLHDCKFQWNLNISMHVATAFLLNFILKKTSIISSQCNIQTINSQKNFYIIIL